MLNTTFFEPFTSLTREADIEELTLQVHHCSSIYQHCSEISPLFIIPSLSPSLFQLVNGIMACWLVALEFHIFIIKPGASTSYGLREVSSEMSSHTSSSKCSRGKSTTMPLVHRKDKGFHLT
jgi:hypothetical protein